MTKPHERFDTGEVSVDEILGQKVSPVEQQIFDGRKSRVRRIFGVAVWICAILLATLTCMTLVALVQIVR